MSLPKWETARLFLVNLWIWPYQSVGRDSLKLHKDFSAHLNWWDGLIKNGEWGPPNITERSCRSHLSSVEHSVSIHSHSPRARILLLSRGQGQMMRREPQLRTDSLNSYLDQDEVTVVWTWLPLRGHRPHPHSAATWSKGDRHKTESMLPLLECRYKRPFWTP